MKSIITIILLSTLTLTSCGSTVVVDPVVVKTPFVIETYTIGQSQTGITIEKTGRITASSSLTLTAQ